MAVHTNKTVIPIVFVNFTYLGTILYLGKINWMGFIYNGIAQVICLATSFWYTKCAICMEKVYHAWFFFLATKGKDYIDLSYNGILLLSLVGLIVWIVVREYQFEKEVLTRMLWIDDDSPKYGSTPQGEDVDPAALLTNMRTWITEQISSVLEWILDSCSFLNINT